MDKLRMVGGTALKGEVVIAGAKNAALPILCACLLTDQSIVLRNVPDLQDVRTMLKLLQEMGVIVSFPDGADRSHLVLNAANIKSSEATYEMVKTMRASILVLGPLLARMHSAKVSLPGGCATYNLFVASAKQSLKPQRRSRQQSPNYPKGKYLTPQRSHNEIHQSYKRTD